MMSDRNQFENQFENPCGYCHADDGTRTVTAGSVTLTIFIFMLTLCSVSCAPKPVQRVYPVAKTDFGPLQKDPDLQLEKIKAYSIDSSKLKWRGRVESARVFRFANSLISLGQSHSSPALLGLGQKIGSTFYRASGVVTRSDLTQTVYVQAAIGETHDDVFVLLDKNDKMLADQLPRLKSLLTSTAASLTWPLIGTEPKAALAFLRSYATHFLRAASSNGIDDNVYNGLVSAFNSDLFPIVDQLSKEIDLILGEDTPIKVIDHLKRFIAAFDFKLLDSTTEMIDQARTAFLDIAAISSAQDALSVIVELWEMTDVDNRQATFEPVSKALYSFLKSKSPSELACIKSPSCLNPLIFLPKKLVVLPAIENYGLVKLKTDIAKAAQAALVTAISNAIVAFVQAVPAELDQRITVQLTQIRTIIQSVRSDYPSFIRGIVREYQAQYLLEAKDDIKIDGLEASQVAIALAPGSLAIARAEKWPIPSKAGKFVSSDGRSSFTTGNEVIGDSMLYAASSWSTGDSKSVSYQKSVISQVSKLLAIGGFKALAKTPYPSLTISLDPAVTKRFNIREDITGPTPFAVPDSFQISPELTPIEAKGGNNASFNVSVRGQAEMLRGLSAMIRYFRDWEKNGFDNSLGRIGVGQLIKNLPAGSVKSKLFPKDSFFALSVANAATILENITKSLSPVFLIDIAKKTTWANNRSDDTDQPATMAAMVDIIGGRRTSVVHAVDTARFLLAIADFLDATAGIEKTHAAPLLNPGPSVSAKNAVDTLVEAKPSMILLMVGLSNFLAHEMQSADGGIRASFQQNSLQPSANEPRLAVDQAVCILALMKASGIIGKDLYVWPALDAYAFMNRSLFNSSTGFYRVSENNADLPTPDEVALILQAGDALRARMTETSRAQWDALSTPWLKAIEGLN